MNVMGNNPQDRISELWDSITPKLYGYLINTLKDKALADDILQSAWLKAIEALPQFNARGAGFSAWIFAIARNEMKMHWRKSGREVQYDEGLHDLPDHASSETEDKVLVDQILATLSEDERELIHLRYIGGLSLGEIAKILKINPIAARVRMHRALANARTKLTQK
jgi:RNA polymerase sigma-70 factor (ECF subfamily)